LEAKTWSEKKRLRRDLYLDESSEKCTPKSGVIVHQLSAEEAVYDPNEIRFAATTGGLY
jgi:hypothetical protein